jgi:hypothetical protein
MTPNDTAKTISTDGSLADVQAAVTYMVGKAQDGWVITIGVDGGSYTWTNTLTIPSTFNQVYTITGAGSTTTRSKITSTHSNYSSITLQTNNNKLARFTNCIFTSTGSNAGGFLHVQPPASGIARLAFRIDNCDFADTQPFAIKINDDNQNNATVYGLIDHCAFTQTGEGMNGIYSFAGGTANQWATSMTLGTTDAIYIEDCTWNNTGNNTSSVIGRPAIDSAYFGVRWVARHCNFTNWTCVLHGADSAPNSTLQVEFYNNTLTIVNGASSPADYGLYNRGGVTIAYNNTFVPGAVGFPNQCFKFANDSTNGFEKVGQGCVNGVETLLGSYFYNNTTNGAPLFFPNATSPQFPTGLALNTNIFAQAPGPGLPLTSYTALSYPHPLQNATTPSNVHYVSFNLGSDSNDGNTPTTPWQNCPGMSTYTGSGVLNPGDTVYFDRASTWTMPAANQGLYLTGGVTYIGNSFGTGTARAILRAGGTLTAGTVRFIDHPTIPTIFQGFEVDTNNQVNNGIDINHRFFVLMNGATKRVQDCIVHNNFSDQTQNQFTYGIIVSNNGGLQGLVANVEIISTICHDTSRDAICLYTGDQDANCNITNCTVRMCEAYNTGQDPAYTAGSGFLVKGQVTNGTVEYCYAHDTKGAPIFISSDETNHFAGVGLVNIHIRYNVATTNNVNGGIRVYSQASGSDPKDLKIYGNIVYNETTTGGLYIGNENGSTMSLLIYNNTFYNAPVVFTNFPATVTAFEFRNNICVGIGNGIPLTDAGGKIQLHSNNIFRAPSGTLVSSGATNYTAATLSNYEATALSSDPLFASTSNLPTVFAGVYGSTLAPAANGLSLITGSPGLNSGAVLSTGGGYNTLFPLTENPISESGHWQSGAAFGFSDVRTTAGLAFGTQLGTLSQPQQFADSTALLTGTWGPNQTVTAKLRVLSAPSSSSIFTEVECRLRSNFGSNSCTGYEVNLSVSTNTNNLYCQIVRWNGPLGNFTLLNSQGGVHGVDGDIFMATISGTTITAFLNGAQIVTWTDSTYSTGQPGMGFFLEGTSGINANYGFQSYTASDGTQTLSYNNSINSVVRTATAWDRGAYQGATSAIQPVFASVFIR